MSDRKYPQDIGGEYNFEVGYRSSREYVDGRMVDVANYVVQLPHQCDEWVISDDRDKADAVADLEQFIAEAQNALAALNALD